MRHKINFVCEKNNWQSFQIRWIIRTCIHATVSAEGVHTPCEINVLLTNDEGIRTINRESR